jgi:hypothetical protein
MPDGVAERICDTPERVFVEPHAPYRPCGIPVRGLHIDPRERSRCRAYIPTALLEGTYVSKHEGELVSVRIIPNEHGKPSGKLADAEVVFAKRCRPAQRPHAGRVCRLGASRCGEKRDVSRQAVLRDGVRRNLLLLRSSNRALEAQEPLRQYILDAYSRLEERA